jgi:hypothetical protein
MIRDGIINLDSMPTLEKEIARWTRGTLAEVASIRLNGRLYDVFSDAPCIAEGRGRLLCLIETTPHVQWILTTDNDSHDSIRSLVPKSWWCNFREVFVLPSNLQILHTIPLGDPVVTQKPRGEPRSSAALLQKLRDEPGRTAKMAADLLVEIVRQKAREDVNDKTISGLSPVDFAKLVGEVAADLVKERALK